MPAFNIVDRLFGLIILQILAGALVCIWGDPVKVEAHANVILTLFWTACATFFLAARCDYLIKRAARRGN